MIQQTFRRKYYSMHLITMVTIIEYEDKSIENHVVCFRYACGAMWKNTYLVINASVYIIMLYCCIIGFIFVKQYMLNMVKNDCALKFSMHWTLHYKQPKSVRVATMLGFC